MSKYPMTHERYIQCVRDIALNYARLNRDNPNRQIVKSLPVLSDAQLEDIAHAKLVYGRGAITLRGVTQHGAWNNGRSHQCENPKSDDLVEVCALGEDSPVQVAGTTIHELAHVACGVGVGHARQWKIACMALGLRCVKAAGTRYSMAMFAPEVRDAIARLETPQDGFPKNQLAGLAGLLVMRPCRAGIGVRGGKSVGPGSGRLRKYVCPHGQIIRASTDYLEATCDVCNGKFELASAPKAPYVGHLPLGVM